VLAYFYGIACNGDTRKHTDKSARGQHTRQRDEHHNERAYLIGITERRITCILEARRCCLKSKSAIILVLCWNTLITILIGYVLDYGLVYATAANKVQIYYAPGNFSFFAFLYLFYPLDDVWLT
jgi:hypothetical protein